MFCHLLTSTEDFPKILWVFRGTAEAIFRPTGKQQLHLWFKSKGKFTRHHPSYTKIHIYVFLRLFSPTLHHRAYILTMSALSRIHRSQLNLLPFCSPCHLIFSFSFSSSYFPWKIKAGLEMQAVQIQRKIGQDPEEKDCGNSASRVPCPKASSNTAIAADWRLLLTHLICGTATTGSPHICSVTATHPSYHLSLINHVIWSSVLPLHPHSHISEVSVTPLFTALSCPMCSVSSCTSKVQNYLEPHQMH